ncbi:MAG: FHA domain-containing protein [Candidatus Viridilinea halotolerans]|uniref:FHA domain-containing protein n=1 Tax=Candidatus Viridilinea halotolerans TaxID=2491704 RepID=A0A426TSB2_9CHLR|nr:MAG: FHA domain-containing protein [Candidatus Viridilinea halotolerans]
MQGGKGWGIASSIYNWISGVGDVGLGVVGIIMLGAFQSAIQSLITGVNLMGGIGSAMGDPTASAAAGAASSGLEVVGAMAYLPVLILIMLILGGIGRCVMGYGLLVDHNWARIGAIVFHFLSMAGALFLVIGLVRLEFYPWATIPLMFLIGNIVLAVGLFLPGTAAVYAGGGAFPPLRQTQIAPVFAPAPTFSPIPAPSAPPPPTYASPRQAGVARTEVAGPSGPGVIAWLIERNSSRPGREHRLGEQITIGRDPGRCEVVFEDSKISSEHARIRFENDRYILFDLASRNHTYVNNQEIQRHALKDGDQIRLGPNVQLVFMEAKRP